MILYTMMPYEMVFPTAEADYGKQSIVHLDGIDLLVMENNSSEYEIIRILSSNPNHFLNEKYCPGQKISSHLVCATQ